MTKHVEFSSTPNIGTKVFLNQQRFEVVAAEPVIKRDGNPTTMLTWLATCTRCGFDFETCTGLVCKSLPRRCEKCRKVARSVINGKRRKLVNVQVIPA